MRKILFILTLILSSMAVNAIPLFPFFVDVAGDYNDGTPDEFKELFIESMYYRHNPGFYKTIEEADSFLNDVLPYSNYTIYRTKTEKNGVKMVVFSSNMEEGASFLYLVEIPQKGFFIGYAEPRYDGKK